jgi:uncharacterized protein (TIGR01319 family)
MLSRLAVKTAVDRHAGTVELVVTHNGDFWVQRGKDLTLVKTVIGAGGPCLFLEPAPGAGGGRFPARRAEYLKPKTPRLLIDQKLSCSPFGLLAQSDPVKALRIIKKYLAEI